MSTSEEQRLVEQLEQTKQRLQDLRVQRVTSQYTTDYYARLAQAVCQRDEASRLIRQAEQDAAEYKFLCGRIPPGFYCSTSRCDDHNCRDGDCNYALDDGAIKHLARAGATL